MLMRSRNKGHCIVKTKFAQSQFHESRFTNKQKYKWQQMNLEFIDQTNLRDIWCDRKIPGSLHHDIWEDPRCPCSRNTWLQIQVIHDQRNQWDNWSTDHMVKFGENCFQGYTPWNWGKIWSLAGLSQRSYVSKWACRAANAMVTLTSGHVRCGATKVELLMSTPARTDSRYVASLWHASKGSCMAGSMLSSSVTRWAPS